MSQRDFIEAVLGTMQGNAVLGLRDRPGPRGKVNRYSDFKYPEQLDEMVKFAAEHSNEDLYISPLVYGDERNPENGKVRRTPENALMSNTIYQDSDTCTPDSFRLPPSIHVQSSAGRYQDFWVLNEPIPATEAATISHKIATAHKDDGSDPSSWSANKVLRIPFSHNTSHGLPEDVTVEYSGMVYDSLDIAGAYDDVDLVERAIIRLPADVSYDTDQDLPDYATALDKLPRDFDANILIKEVPDGTDRSRLRYRLLADLFRAGTLSFEEVLSLAWHAPASRKWREDPRNLRGLIAEALKAQEEVSYEPGRTELDQGEFDDEGESNQDWPSLLSDAERSAIQGDDNWLRRYDEWTRSKLGRVYNGPYCRMDAWQILSSAFSDLGFIPRGNGPEYLNLYSLTIGPSGSGKSQSLKSYKTVEDELFEADKGWYIGSNASPNALHEHLLGRDNKFSCLLADEAHGWFNQVNNQQWADGIYENLALYYDGEIPPMLRTGNREISGKSAKAFFNIHLRGTLKGDMSITNVLTRHMFYSGFLARFIWTIGNDSEMTEDTMAESQSNGDYIRLGYEPVARQWVAEFNNTKRITRTKHKRKSVPMMMDRDALARMGEVKWKMTQLYREDRNWDILQPAIMRMGTNIRKAASLLALEEGADTVSLRHTLIAIGAAEEWVHALAVMADKISDSEWKRSTDEVYNFIAAKDRVSKEVLNRRFDSRELRVLNQQIEALKAQGKIYEKSESGRIWVAAQR
jgi:hypothetical protein